MHVLNCAARVGCVDVPANSKTVKSVGRWTLVGFGGVGHTDGDLPVSESQTIWAGGVGFRYLIAKRLGLKTGIDLAWSEEDFAFYIATGTGWR